MANSIHRGSLNELRKQINFDRSRLNDIEDTKAQETIVNGRFAVNNPGEAYHAIWFPHVFATLPSITFGFEIDSTNSIRVKRAPVITAQVYEWLTTERLPTLRLFIGARVLVVSEGAMASAFTVTWSAHGVAYSNPRY